MDSDVFIGEIFKFIDEALSDFLQHREILSVIANVKQTSNGTIRIKTKDGRSFLIVMIEDNA